MATLEDEIRDLKEKNNELAQKVQYWKMTAAERENEKINLMKEMNELRLKLSRLKNTGGFEAQKLDTALQQASEKAISHLVKASAEIARSMEIAKAYMRDRQELEVQSPRWSNIGGTPVAERTDKVHRVPPLMIGGQSIQPVVALSRTMPNTSNPRSTTRSPNRSLTERAVPMHMLQDVYIPLTRIDIADLPVNNMETDTEANIAEDSAEELGLEDETEEQVDESRNISEDDGEYSGRKLHALTEEDSDLDEMENPRLTLHLDNPLEGPSWLLDSPADSRSSKPTRTRANFEPDSTTELERISNTSCPETEDNTQKEGGVSVRVSCEFSPTVRRRKRTSSPPQATPRQSHYSPRPASARKNSTCSRVLKVLVAKMHIDSDTEASSPLAKRSRSTSHDSLMTFDAPSPNGATDSAVIVSNRANATRLDPGTSANQSSSLIRRSHFNSQDSRSSHLRLSQDTFEPRIEQSQSRNNRRVLSQERDSVQRRIDSCERDSVQSRIDSRDSDSGSGGDSISEGRTRRPRKAITYKEKPLNRKLRR